MDVYYVVHCPRLSVARVTAHARQVEARASLYTRNRSTGGFSVAISFFHPSYLKLPLDGAELTSLLLWCVYELSSTAADINRH